MTGADKKLNYPNFRGIKINDEQNKNWNKNTSKQIRDLLEGKLDLDTKILLKMIPEFKKNGIIVNLENNELERVKELYARI